MSLPPRSGLTIALLSPLAVPVSAGTADYQEEEVAYTNAADGVRLAGTLSLPGRVPCPAILLITGPGPQDRDETLAHLKPFAVLAKAFTGQGFAVLRVDDRGVGKSTGNWIETSYRGYAADVRRGLEYLMSRREIDPKRIGLLGHSEGAVIGSMVAATCSDVAFLVLIGGPCISGDQVVLTQNELMLRNTQNSETDIQIALDWVKKLISLYRSDLPRQEFEARLLEAVRSKTPPQSEEEVQKEVNMLKTPWAKDYFTYDPAPYLRKVRCPILAVWGEKEQNVTALDNSRALAEALQQSGNQS